MVDQTRNKIVLEVVGLISTVLITAIILYPLVVNEVSFKYMPHNIVLLLVGLNFVRWQFMIKYSFIGGSRILHMLMFVISLYITVYFYGVYGDFKFYYEEVDLSQLLGHLSYQKTVWIRNYLKAEFTFSAVLAIVACISFCVRLIRSVFSLYKNGTFK